MNYKHVKQRITTELLWALHDANMADCTESAYGYGVNDLAAVNSRQHDLYGHLSDALDALGHIAQEAREIYVSTGDIDDAHRFIIEQYNQLKAASA